MTSPTIGAPASTAMHAGWEGVSVRIEPVPAPWR
jgi:hypothetical protein